MSTPGSAVASIAEIDALVAGSTAPKAFLSLVDAHPDEAALHASTNSGIAGSSGVAGDWQVWTFADYAQQVSKAAAGLRQLGVGPGDRVLMMMRNRPDFHWFDMAAQFLRATPVSIYNSSSPEEMQYLAHHAEASVVIVEDVGYLHRLSQVRAALPALQHIFVIEPTTDSATADDWPTDVSPAGDLMNQGSLDLHELAEATHPDDVATLIYTSGTTGPPKGVMISQYNVVYTVESLRQGIGFQSFVGKRVVSYLPMAHIAERMMSHYQGAMLGYSVYCCPEAGQLAGVLASVKPQLMFGVPRVWEKIHNGVVAALAGDPDTQAKFDEGMQAALVIKQAERDGTATQEQLDTWAFLDAVAFRNVRALVGLDEIQVAVTGAAAIPRTVLEWYNAVGVPLSEIYGMSESSGPISWSPEANRPGSVGRVIPGCEVLVADDGEVVCRGGNVFQGYLKQPDKTAESLVDGWLHTGDIGVLDDDGYLHIVDRKKELIITSGGKNISPANLEAALKTIPLVGQAAAIGDGRKFVSAILVLDPEAATVWAANNGRPGRAMDDLAADSDVRAEIQTGVDEINQQFAQVEQIKRFTLVGAEWLPDSDVLTPTSKLKRRGVNARYAAEIEAMYT